MSHNAALTPLSFPARNVSVTASKYRPRVRNHQVVSSALLMLTDTVFALHPCAMLCSLCYVFSWFWLAPSGLGHVPNRLRRQLVIALLGKITFDYRSGQQGRTRTSGIKIDRAKHGPSFEQQ
jgi:hypothetical protein